MSVLLCDDHVLFADALADALRLVGHEVSAVLSDPDALPAAVELGRPELCLMGVLYQGAYRLDAAINVRRHSPDTVVVLLTATNQAPMWEALEAGVIQGIVAKHCGLRELDRLIRRALSGRRAIGGLVPPQRRRPPEIRLTARETQILSLLDAGLSTDAMADRLGVSAHTVRSHVQGLLQKLNAPNRVHAVQRAHQLGLLHEPLSLPA